MDSDVPVSPLVAMLAPDPGARASDLVLLRGYVGGSSDEEHLRLYLFAALDSYIDIPRDAIAGHDRLTLGDSPTRDTTAIWVQPDARLRPMPVEGHDAAEEFLARHLPDGLRGNPILGIDPDDDETSLKSHWYVCPSCAKKTRHLI